MENLNISLESMDRDNSNVDIVSKDTKIVDVTDVTTGQQSSTTTPLNTTPPDNTTPEQSSTTTTDSDTTTTTDTTPEISTDEAVNLFLSGDNLSEEEIADRDKLFAIYGARGYDPNKNLLDKDGNVVLLYSDLHKFIEKGTLPVNDKGQLLYANGNVVETATLTSFVDEANVFLQNEYGFNIPNLEEINAIEDETERRNVMYKSIVATAHNEGINKFLQSNPIIADFHNHLRLGGTPESYKGSGIDYSKIDINQLGVSEKVGLIKDVYKLKNLNIDSSFIKFVEGNEEALNESVTNAIKELDEHHKNKAKENAKLIKEQEQAEKEATDAYWNNIQSIVQKGVLTTDTNIPDKDKEAFFRYLANPVKDGLSQNMIDSDKVTLEEDLLLAFIRFKGKSLNDFINTRANTNTAQKRREILQNYKPIIQSQGTAPTRDVSLKGISLANMKRD